MSVEMIGVYGNINYQSIKEIFLMQIIVIKYLKVFNN